MERRESDTDRKQKHASAHVPPRTSANRGGSNSSVYSRPAVYGQPRREENRPTAARRSGQQNAPRADHARQQSAASREAARKRAEQQREAQRQRALEQRRRQQEQARKAQKQEQAERKRRQREFYKPQRKRVWRARLRLFAVMFVALLLVAVLCFQFFLRISFSTDTYGMTYQFGRTGATGDAAPVVKKQDESQSFYDGVLYINFSDIAKMCGMIVTGDEKQRRFTASDNYDESVLFRFGDAWAVVNGMEWQMEGPARLEDGSVWVPYDFVSNYVLGIRCVQKKKTLTVVREYVNEKLDPLEVKKDEPVQSIRFLLKSVAPMMHLEENDPSSALGFVAELGDYEQYMAPSNRDDYLTLVSKEHPIAAENEPSRENMNEVQYEIRDGIKARYMDPTAEMALRAMFMDMRANGMEDVWVYEAYQSYADIAYYYNNKKITTPPGTVENQTGLSCDIYQENGAQDVSFGSTPAGEWLAQNSWKYGFILRYPTDKVEITGVAYSPWHFRYVGRFHAMRMYQENKCLEEYLKDLENRGY